MHFDDFEALAWQHWERVPAEYKHGTDGLIVERDAKVHPELDEIYTLGECRTESFPSDFGGPDTTRSAVVLYYGSFLRLSRLDPEFDWERELWETLMHELQHHLEALATEDSLEDFDYAVDENFKRLNGEPFDPLFFRAGQAIAKGRYRVDEDVFIERDPAALPGHASWLEFEWEGGRARLPVPAVTADVTFVHLSNGPDLNGGELWIVLVPRRGVLRVLRDALSRRPFEVGEHEVEAEWIS